MMNKNESAEWRRYKVDISIFRMYDENITLSSEYRIAVFPHKSSKSLVKIDFVRTSLMKLHDGAEYESIAGNIGVALFPIELDISENRELVGVRNWKIALRRVKKELKNYACTDHIVKYFAKSVNAIESEEDFAGSLLRSTFFQFMFRNDMGGDMVHFIYNYPKFGNVFPFMCDAESDVYGLNMRNYKAKLGRMDWFGERSYSGSGKLCYNFSDDILPEKVDASFLIESEYEGFFKKEVHIRRLLE